MLCRQVLVVFLASARAWKCPQVECTGWSEAYNNVINGVYLANEATDTAPRWTYTKADAAIHLRFSELHGNAWLVTDSVTAALRPPSDENSRTRDMRHLPCSRRPRSSQRGAASSRTSSLLVGLVDLGSRVLGRLMVGSAS